jgi:vitamin B12 transporter
LLKKLDNNSSLYANAAKSFKMPTFTQIYGGGGANFAANPLLEPEEGWTYEFGYKKTSKYKHVQSCFVLYGFGYY